MSFFNWFKATPKAIETASTVIEAGISGIDKMFYTSEEKAEAHQKLFETWIIMQKAIGSESTARSITRRILAVFIMGEFLFLLFVAAISWPYNPEWTTALLEIASMMTNLVLAVAFFYFGPYQLAKVWKKDDKE